MKQTKTICILGGMGPQASAKFLVDLVDMASNFGARENDSFPEIIVDSVPVPDFISDDRNRRLALLMLAERVKFFSPRVDLFAIVCNTAHLMIADLQKETSKPFVSMIEAVVDDVKVRKLKKVGLLATPTTIRSKLYQKELEACGIKVILPGSEDLVELERLIRSVLAGKSVGVDSRNLVEITGKLIQRGSEGIILGCTELPLIFPKSFELPVFSSSEILARALLGRFFRKEVM